MLFSTSAACFEGGALHHKITYVIMSQFAARGLLRKRRAPEQAGLTLRDLIFIFHLLIFSSPPSNTTVLTNGPKKWSPRLVLNVPCNVFRTRSVPGGLPWAAPKGNHRRKQIRGQIYLRIVPKVCPTSAPGSESLCLAAAACFGGRELSKATSCFQSELAYVMTTHFGFRGLLSMAD